MIIFNKYIIIENYSNKITGMINNPLSVSVETISVETLNFILEKLNDKKITRHQDKKLFRVDKILSVNTRNCRYVGNKTEVKTHLQVKFTSYDENGPICISILLDNYRDIIHE
jgi:hypothetical protein